MRSNTLQRSTTGIIQGLSWCIGAVQCSDWLSHTGASDGEIFCAYRRRSQFQPHADMQRGRCLEITSATADKNSLRHVSHASLPVAGIVESSAINTTSSCQSQAWGGACWASWQGTVLSASPRAHHGKTRRILPLRSSASRPALVLASFIVPQRALIR